MKFAKLVVLLLHCIWNVSLLPPSFALTEMNESLSSPTPVRHVETSYTLTVALILHVDPFEETLPGYLFRGSMRRA